MRILEFFKPEDTNTQGYYDPNADKFNAHHPDDTRKKGLLLKDINRLKKMRAQQKLEALKREDLLAVMYGTADDQGGGGMGF
jgi:hypothetical protein